MRTFKALMFVIQTRDYRSGNDYLESKVNSNPLKLLRANMMRIIVAVMKAIENRSLNETT